MRILIALYLCLLSTLFEGSHSIKIKSDEDLVKLIEKDTPGEPLDPNDLELARDVDDSKAGDPESMRSDPSLSSGFYEGDIMIDQEQLDTLMDDEGAVYRNAVTDERSLWPNGVVPYIVSSAYDANERSVIAAAIRDFSEHTCIKFVPRTNQNHFIHIAKGDGCSSHIGYLGQANQPVSLGYGCVVKGIVIHELMHALGFWHEQSRSDRDNFIMIDESNVRPGMEFNFKKAPFGRVTDLGITYDTGSLLHYGAYAFAADDRKPTIIPRQPAPNMGQRIGFSKSDILKVKKLYCETKTVESKPPAPTGCQDYSEYCPYWIQSMGCSQSAVKTNCPKSCNACGTCEDSSENCDYWAKSGECAKNYVYMTSYCRKSCNLCEKQSGCADSSENCSYWANNGECFNNAVYMNQACKKSCKQC